MLTLVIGGAASGKSEYAEAHVLALLGRRIYIATMEPFDDECRASIQKHRAMRAQKGFETVECYTDLAAASVPPGANVLLECLGNLTANELFSPNGGGEAAIIRGVDVLCEKCENLTVVTNEVFSGGDDYEAGTLNYLRVLAQVNRYIAARADEVIELVCGVPNILKGGERSADT